MNQIQLSHNFAAMIGYVQNDSAASWLVRTNDWIDELVIAHAIGWSSTDRINPISSSSEAKVSTLVSIHARIGGLPAIELNHIWIEL